MAFPFATSDAICFLLLLWDADRPPHMRDAELSSVLLGITIVVF
jgi:hypothetical protein